MSVQITAVDKVPDRPALAAMLHKYIELMLPKLAAVGGPVIAPDEVLGGLWDDIDSYLPPNGALILAHDAQNTLVGCGFLKKIRPDAAELKRLYVLPEYQGKGLGRQLIQARIDAAQDLGVRHLYADTVKGNDGMLSLYKKFGFDFIERYPENANPAEWTPWLVYLHRPLDPV